MSKNLAKYIIVFFIGAFVGWIYEVIFYYFTDGKLINRGVLFGPWLPIYGTGAILIYFFKFFKKNPIILFLSIMIITGILEYLVGYFFLKFFDMKLWDYDGLLFNIHGLVCLRSVITFAIGGMVLIYLVDPIIEKIIKKQSKVLNIAVVVLVFLFIVDTILSLLFRTPHS